ncbi:MAG TPA: hypothetical protein VL361_25735 [Candidatus Limnocylindrales bacterium]|nr:hypothetical protein [Candidatus Limnocylindrales bacterium]
MEEPASENKQRTWRQRLSKIVAIVILLLVCAILLWFSTALYHRLVQFPKEEAAWQALRAERQPVIDHSGWNEYRGILHAHSKFSHDSEVPLEEILRVLQATRIDFIGLSDHPINGRADFDLQWRGLHDGKLFIPGFEMRDGIMPFGVAAGVVLSNQTDSATLARQISEHGGLLFYAHSEEPRDWDRPELVGMEIYNIHTDLKQHRRSLVGMLPDLLLNLRKYPDHVFRNFFHRPTDLLQHWDQLNQKRHLTGVAGNDAHQNVGLRGIYTSSDTLRVEDTSPKTIKELKLNWLTRPIARLLFGPLKPDRRLFHIQLDPYARSARFVNTHVLAHYLSEPDVLDALKAGRAFVGFDMLADSSGFRWFVSGTTNQVVMGESAAFATELRLHAASPLPCRFTVLKDGAGCFQQEGRALDWAPPGPGKYRVEAELRILREWVPWVYANPIELR